MTIPSYVNFHLISRDKKQVDNVSTIGEFRRIVGGQPIYFDGSESMFPDGERLIDDVTFDAESTFEKYNLEHRNGGFGLVFLVRRDASGEVVSSTIEVDETPPTGFRDVEGMAKLIEQLDEFRGIGPRILGFGTGRQLLSQGVTRDRKAAYLFIEQVKEGERKLSPGDVAPMTEDVMASGRARRVFGDIQTGAVTLRFTNRESLAVVIGKVLDLAMVWGDLKELKHEKPSGDGDRLFYSEWYEEFSDLAAKVMEMVRVMPVGERGVAAAGVDSASRN